MKNPQNKKYILQETRPLKDNEFVLARGDCCCSTKAFWDHLLKVYDVDKENIDEVQLPDDSLGYKMHGIRIFKVKDWSKDE